MLEPFHDWFPEIARREARSVDVRDKSERGDIPAGEYFFVESYCTNPDCECERVTISVAERRLGIVGAISYDLDAPRSVSNVNYPNPCLDPSINQSKYAGVALALFKDAILDEQYAELLKRHYRMVKSAAVLASGHEAAVSSRRGARDKQQRKQQKAARRRNRRR